MKKFFTLLTLLVGLCTGAWGADATPTYTQPTTILDLKADGLTTTLSSYTWSSNKSNISQAYSLNDDYLIFPLHILGKTIANNASLTWAVQENSGGNADDGAWTASGIFPASTTFYSTAERQTAKLTTTRMVAVKVTSCSEAYLYAAANCILNVYEVTSTEVAYNTLTKAGTATTSSEGIISVKGLDASKTYIVQATGSTGSNAKGYAIGLKRQDSNEPTVSANTVLITEDATDAGEISYTVDAKGTSGMVTASTEADWITLGAVDAVNNKVPFTATANSTSVSRSATVTLTYTYNTSETVTKDVTVTQGANAKGKSIIKVTLNGGTSATVTGAIGGTADVNVQSDNKFGSGHYAGFTLAGGNTFHIGDIINVNITTAASGSGSIAIYDTDKSTILYDTEVKGSVGNNKFVLPAACNGKSTLYICRTSSNGWNAFVNFIEVSRPASGTISASGWNTFSCSSKLDLSTITNGKAYVATATSGSNVTLTECTGIVAAGTGLMIKGTTDDIFTIQITDDDVTYTGENLLVGLPTGGTVAKNNNNYVFGWSDPASPGFYLVNATEPVLGAGKAYLQTTAALGARLYINFEDENVTGIQSIENEKSTIDNAVYDLSGRRVAQPTKGLYIVNGKKVVIK